MIERIVIGPPGTGKTTWLGAEVEATLDQGKRILICSLTKSAAAEVASRNLPVADENLGTLHSHCYRYLGNPVLAVTPQNVKKWNEIHPERKLTPQSRINLDEPPPAPAGANSNSRSQERPNAATADHLMQQYQLARVRLEDLNANSSTDSDLNAELRALDQQWRAFKESEGLYDYTDLIETCLKQAHPAPGEPHVIFVDEAQDLSPLELELLRHWGQQAGELVLVGDPDQSIYTWRGAAPERLTDPTKIPVQTEIADADRSIETLSQSYRVPIEVHRAATDWIELVPNRPKMDYQPTAQPGAVTQLLCHYEEPEAALHSALRSINSGHSVMLLASCAYMLDPLIKILRASSVPFHNRLRDSNGAWNPMPRTRRGAVSSAARIAAWLNLKESGAWTTRDLENWPRLVKLKGVFLPGAKKRMELTLQNADAQEPHPVDYEDLYDWFTPECLEQSEAGNLQWLQENMTEERRKATVYPMQLSMAQGSEHLVHQPQLLVGTIHSVKGGEADHVIVFPDLSRGGYQEYQENPDSARRLFYVAMTRARHRLTLCYSNHNEYAVDWL